MSTLIRRFYRAVTGDDSAELPLPDVAGLDTHLSRTVINVQGSLQDNGTGQRITGIRHGLTQMAGVSYNDVEQVTIWGSKEQTELPWIIGGRERITLAVDDAIEKRLRHRNPKKPILEARRALRNRTLSVIEMALSVKMLITLIEVYLQKEAQIWETEILVSYGQRAANFGKQPNVTARLFGTLLYEVGSFLENLKKADPHNSEMWLKLAVHVWQQTDEQADLEPFVKRVQDLMNTLQQDIANRQQQRYERINNAANSLMALGALLVAGVGVSGPTTNPATPPTQVPTPSGSGPQP